MRNQTRWQKIKNIRLLRWLLSWTFVKLQYTCLEMQIYLSVEYKKMWNLPWYEFSFCAWIMSVQYSAPLCHCICIILWLTTSLGTPVNFKWLSNQPIHGIQIQVKSFRNQAMFCSSLHLSAFCELAPTVSCSSGTPIWSSIAYSEMLLCSWRLWRVFIPVTIDFL